MSLPNFVEIERRFITGKPPVVSASGAAPPGCNPGGGGPQQPQAAGVPVSSGATRVRRYPRWQNVCESQPKFQTLRPLVTSIIDHYPAGIRNDVLRQYEDSTIGKDAWALTGNDRTKSVLEGGSPNSEFAFLRKIRRQQEELASANFTTAYCEVEIELLAEQCARRCRELTNLHGDNCYQRLVRLAEINGISAPVPAEGNKSLRSCIRRLMCQRWWRRRIRSTHCRMAEEQLRKFGYVSKRRGLYSSDDNVTRFLQHRQRQRAGLEAMLAVSDFGDSVSLASIADHSISNPKIRRAELMTRVSGFEEYAKAHGYQAIFAVITTPSRFHAVSAATGRQNPRFDGSSPRDAQAWLQLHWTRVRALLNRRGIAVFGLRTVEPHHDGTPHWNLLLFVRTSAQIQLRAILFRYFLDSESPNENGASTHRVKITEIDPQKGRASGYVAKYVAKCIDGTGVGLDHSDNERGRQCSETCTRINAWASTHGIRLFQQIGGPTVMVYRELRRIREVTCDSIEPFRVAADDGDWGQFVSIMLGIDCRHDARPIRVFRVASDREGVYGDPPGHLIQGIESDLERVTTRTKRWELMRVADPPRICAAHLKFAFPPLEYCQ